MGKPRKSASMGAAECARRTGLTVRALRVYERRGLIEPPRSGKGWRRYGPKELKRLNVIVTLKALGMTLAQIRSLLETRPPPLARVLGMQLRACEARRDTAEKALGVVRAALTTIESGQPLSLQELCNLTRSMEMASPHAIARTLINEEITPEEERAYMTWWATRPPDETKAMQEYGTEVRRIFRSLQDLRERKVDPTAARPQELIAEWNELALRCRLRDTMVALLEWNPGVAQKYLDVGERVLSRSLSSAPAAQAALDDGLWSYFGAAQAACAWHRETVRLADEAALLVEKSVQPSSPAAQALADRLVRICAKHSLGDPWVYARWAGAMQFRKSVDAGVNARARTAWAYLASAVRAASPSSP